MTFSQHTYVQNVLRHYRLNDIQQGDPNEGDWHQAHYPRPRCLGSHETVLLLKQHHAVQGVLQSEEFQTCCLLGWEKEFVVGTKYEPLFYKWMRAQRVAAGHSSGWKPIIVTTPEGEEIYFKQMKLACEKFNLHYSLLTEVAKGRRPHTKGYTVRYVEEAH